MATLWAVRFVTPAVLDRFVTPGTWRHDPAVLERAATALGYVPATTWTHGECAGPCGVLVPCPWCWAIALIVFQGHEHGGGAGWAYNGDPDRPTITPSLRRIPTELEACALHIWIQDGQIRDAGTPPHARRIPDA